MTLRERTRRFTRPPGRADGGGLVDAPRSAQADAPHRQRSAARASIRRARGWPASGAGVAAGPLIPRGAGSSVASASSCDDAARLSATSAPSSSGRSGSHLRRFPRPRTAHSLSGTPELRVGETFNFRAATGSSSASDRSLPPNSIGGWLRARLRPISSGLLDRRSTLKQLVDRHELRAGRAQRPEQLRQRLRRHGRPAMHQHD